MPTRSAKPKRLRSSFITTTAAGQRLRVYRLAAGLNQTTLGEQMGLGPSDISGFELGERRWSVDMLKRAADILDCEVGDIQPDSEMLAAISLLRSPEPSIWVARTVCDTHGLAAIGRGPAILAVQLNDVRFAAEGRFRLRVRDDLPAYGPIPHDGDGLGIDYRRQIYAWADRYIGDKTTDRSRELFRRVHVEGENMKAVGREMGFKIPTGKNSSVRQCLWTARNIYDRLIMSPVGSQMAGIIIKAIASPSPGRPGR